MDRQIGLLIDRKGKARMVIVGQPGSIYIPDLPPMPKGGKRLRGWRLLHTHLNPDGLSQEDLMDLLFLRLDAVVSLSVTEFGEPCQWQGAWLAPINPFAKKDTPYFVDKQKAWHDCAWDLQDITSQFEKEASSNQTLACGDNNALLISVSSLPLLEQERNLDELAELAATAGLKVCGRMCQRVNQPNPNSILGKGKLAELEIMALNNNAEILIFDGELTPGQLHNLADLTERKTIDRTQLILDIFAQHAVSRAGKLQVELAQLAYNQPRLANQSHALDRLMGGIGGRGPGESKLETDRRKSRQRMAFLKKELKNLRKQRSFVRNRRSRNGIPVVALVGYTNAGKSTLLNAITGSQVLTENKLFATLDPTIRRVRFPAEKEITLADTVGFIRNLPNELLEAFQATLEELESADLLLHVADSMHPDLMQQIAAVETVLEDLKLAEIPRLLVLNKCDGLPSEEAQNLREIFPDAIMLSAKEKLNLNTLLETVEQRLFTH